jgi:hypothetical protein
MESSDENDGQIERAKKFLPGQMVQVRLPESEPGKRDGGLYRALFIEYVGQDQCRVRWPEWGVGFAPAPIVDLDDVT